ncbi:MAG TPA: CBS domain-containing protein [Candidatus Baltobacteraceae bacterium]|nr:CBS domain-containing protein [Candidatus Baltobacteraceae bacterium]
MLNVEQILQAKGRQFWCISPDAMVYDALALMADKDVGALLVMQNGRLVGIMSERDYARKVILSGKSSLRTAVRDIMTEQVTTVRPEMTVEQCMALVTEKHIRHLPVLSGDKVVGVVSIGDLVKATIESKDFTIQQLEGYITGR